MSHTRQGRKQWQVDLDQRGAIRFDWAEKFATGAICLSWDRYSPSLDEFDRGDLFSRELRLIWDAAYELAAIDQPVNAVTIADQMAQAGTLEELPDGMHYLLELLDQVENAHDAFHFAEWLKIIARHAALRRFMSGAQQILAAADSSRNLESMRSAMGALLDQIPEPPSKREAVLADAVESELAKIEAGTPEALRVTVPDIDQLTNGFAQPELVVIAARPSQGKTMIAVQMIDEASRHGYPSLIVSEEMSIGALARRSILRISSVVKDRWREDMGQVRYEMREHFQNAAPIVIREFSVTVDRVERAIASAVNRYGIKFCVVDYAQLIEGEGNNIREKTGDVSTRMKRAANRHGITVFLLAQLGRDIDKRDGFVPIMSDLKETGQLEQDADVILAGIWPIKFDDTYPDPHEYRVHHLKNRNRGVFESMAKLYMEPIRQRIRSATEIPQW